MSNGIVDEPQLAWEVMFVTRAVTYTICVTCTCGVIPPQPWGPTARRIHQMLVQGKGYSVGRGQTVGGHSEVNNWKILQE